jgi:hypothetical protein
LTHAVIFFLFKISCSEFQPTPHDTFMTRLMTLS